VQRPLRSLSTLLVAITLGTAAAAEPAPRVASELRDRAAGGETLRVLVRLDEAPVRDALLPDEPARRRQRGRIAAARSALLRETGLPGTALRRGFETLPWVALEIEAAGLAALERSSRVLRVQEDRLARPLLDVSVPQIEADLTTALGFDGAGQAVVVLDTGVDGGHPNLAGRIVAEACFSDGDCPNGQDQDTGPGAGGSCTWSPDCFHGTHVAGIAVGAGGGRSGVAPEASLVPIQVFSLLTGASCPPGESPCPASYASDQIAALEHVYLVLRHEHAIASVNMSLGGAAWTDQPTCDALNPATKAAIDDLRDVGIATVAAAGNDGYLNAIGEPACISSAVSVSAVDDGDAIPLFANAAAFLSLWAPGVGIVAPFWHSSGFASASGTSMATPHVAGAWAVLQQGIVAARGAPAPVAEVLGALQASGVPIPDVYAQTSRIRVQQATSLLFPCANGIDDDGDGLADAGSDPGCSDGADGSEREPGFVCDNGLDDDGDGTSDGADPGCRDPAWPLEDPDCDDGLDNDLDGGIDFDGAGLGPADAQCAGKAWEIREAPVACGLGAELALLLPFVGWILRRPR
jgi:subtilisin family serine protease